MYIYSKWSEKDMIKLSANNSVADLYELLGIYITYCHDPLEKDFKEYYSRNVGNQPHHFRNIGERKVKNSLQEKGYMVSRKEIRLLSRTYQNIPVIASSRMGVVFGEIVNQVYDLKVLEEALTQFKVEFTPREFLYFQHYLVSEYVYIKDYAKSFKKREVFKNVLNEWENNRIFKGQYA